jgi:hypothetical protein
VAEKAMKEGFIRLIHTLVKSNRGATERA